MKKLLRLFCALLVAAVAAGFFPLAWLVFKDAPAFFNFPGHVLRIWAFGIGIASIYVIGLGLPTYLILHKFKLIKWWSSILSGLVIGVAPTCVIFLPKYGFNGIIRILFYQLAIGAVVGMIGGFFFWLTWKSMSPAKKAE